jgi:hypothetical protein
MHRRHSIADSKLGRGGDVFAHGMNGPCDIIAGVEGEIAGGKMRPVLTGQINQ